MMDDATAAQVAVDSADLLATLLANVGGWEIQKVGGNVECRVAEYRDPEDPTRVLVFVVGPNPDFDTWGLYTREAWYDGADPKTGTEAFQSGRIRTVGNPDSPIATGSVL